MKHSLINSAKLIIVLFCISSCSIDYKTKTEEQLEHEMAVKHKIKSITEYKIIFQFGLEQKERINRLKSFDKNGFKQKEIAYSEGNIENSSTFEYDKSGNLLNVNAINPDSSFLFKITRNYYENNLRKDLYFYLPDNTYKYKNVATYDKSGRMTELKYYWPDGLKSINKYSYRGSKKMEDTEYSPEGEFRYKWIYQYDNRDNLIEAVQYYPDNKINAQVRYEYYRGKLLLKQNNYFGESLQNVFSFTYNDKKLIESKTETTSGGMISAKYSYRYEFY